MRLRLKADFRQNRWSISRCSNCRSNERWLNSLLIRIRLLCIFFDCYGLALSGMVLRSSLRNPLACTPTFARAFVACGFAADGVDDHRSNNSKNTENEKD